MRKLRSPGLFVVPLIVLSSVPGAWAQAPQVAHRDAEFEVVVQPDTKIAVRDGTSLAADIYRPARDGKVVEGRFPTLLTRTPYNKAGAAAEGRYYAKHGYVVVANDVRGRYA